ncbi:MAG TPA: class I SAM-dependent methyltransferase [Candidatus Sulfomarinibacteraceae bacterium]|nr:class I SAM-dependent methyltransferase [Candidatus Sulfomarinibacteraceae bacterium]
MNERVRALAEKIVPRPLLIKGWEVYCRWRARKALRVFRQAPETPAYLDRKMLERLQKEYPPVKWDYLYDEDSLAQRGRERAEMMLEFIPEGRQTVNRFLDLGAWDGMCCAALEQMGKETVGIDIRAEGFTDVARHSGVDFLQMDAADLGFEANSFDFIFSFNSFEHFPEPDRVLGEAVRVLRPGGYIYLDFGPLYWSAKGSHQFRTIHVPYHQCLFTKETLTEFAADEGIELMGFFWMNEWRVDQYRQLWQDHAHHLETLFYYETLNAVHVDLITHYPSCFKSKAKDFDNFLVAYIELLFQKRR